MGFSSQLLPGEIIINDHTRQESFGSPEGFGTGYQGMFRSSQSRDELTIPFPKSLYVPRADWQGMIQEKQERKARKSDRIIQAGLKCKNQQQTFYCWGNAPTHLVEIARMAQNEPYEELSPASVCCPINNFVNQGGYGEDALRQLITHGAVPSRLWPSNAIDRRYYTQANMDVAKKYRVVKWYNVKPRNEEEYISCLLRDICVANGYNWQGHETCGIEAVWIDGAIATRNRNSWSMDWPSRGAGGWYILQGNRMLPDDSVAVCSVVA